MDYYRKRKLIKPQHSSDDCVCDIVRKIIESQDKMTDTDLCHNPIQQLQGKGKEKEPDPQKTTIPFILYGGGTYEPFIGSGVFQAPANDENGETFFGCVETPIFRATQFIKNSDCCVKLELLLPLSNGCEVKSFTLNNLSNISPFFPESNPVTDFIATGVFLTIDLKHFVGITCLDPICPL